MAAKKAAKSNTKKVKPTKPASKSPAKSLLNKAAKQVAKKISSVIGTKSATKAPAKKPAKLAAKVSKPVKNAKPVAAKATAVAAKKAPLAKTPVTKVQAKAPVVAKVAAAAKIAKPDLKAAKGKAKGGAVIEVEVSAFKAKGKEVKGKKAEAGTKIKELKKKCREPACDNDPLLVGFCRMHYIKNWRKIKRKEAILATGQLNNYVEELVSKYPDKYLDVIRQDLSTEKDWTKVVVDLELEGGDDDLLGDEESEVAAEGVRRDRDFDDDNDSF